MLGVIAMQPYVHQAVGLRDEAFCKLVNSVQNGCHIYP